MGAVWIPVRGELQRRWRSLAVLGLFGALVGAAVLGGLTGARRTSTAYDRLVAATSTWDAEVALATGDALDAVRALPSVEAAWTGELNVGQVLGAEEVVYLGIMSGPPLEEGANHHQPLVVEGRLFDPEADDEIVVSELTARFLDWEVGDSIDFGGLSPAQYAAFEEGEVPDTPGGSRVRLTVTGLVRDPNDALPFELPRILASPGYHREHAPQTGGIAMLSVQLAEGAADVDELREEVVALAGEDAIRSIRSHHQLRATADRATDVAARGLLVFSACAAIAGLVALGQAFHRVLLLRGDELEVLRALGMSRRSRLATLALPMGLTVAVAVAGAVAGAIAGSRWTPVGVGRSIEPDPGIELNLALLALGAIGVAVVLAGLVALTSLNALRHRSGGDAVTRPSALVSAATASGAPVPWVIGARFAVEPARGRSALPTRSALAGVLFGVAGLIASISIVASLDELHSSPDRYGWNHDFTVSDVSPEVVADLVADPDLAAVSEVREGDVEIAGRTVDALFVEPRKGSTEETILEGRMPVGAGEVALGPALARRLDVGVGDDVAVAAADGRPVRIRVVGLALTESPGEFAGRAVFDAAALTEVAVRNDFQEAYVVVDPAADRPAVIAELARTKELSLPEHPAELLNLVQTRTVIRLLAVFLGMVAVAATAHVLAVTTARRRRELAVLRALGFTGGQLGRSIVAMAAVLAAIGLVIGLPAGMVLGTVAWRAMTGSMDLPGDLSTSTLSLGVVTAATFAIAALLALGPARRAATLPSSALRTE